MNEQEKYWELIKQVRFERYYLDEYIRSTNTLESWVNGITAVASSTSIAGWAVWKEWGFAWASVIAISQVINALRPLLPYTKRLKLLQEMHGEMSRLTLEVEYLWFGISQGEFTEGEIHTKLFDLRKKQEEISNRHLSNHVLPKKSKLIEKANTEVDRYLQKNYIGDNHE